MVITRFLRRAPAGAIVAAATVAAVDWLLSPLAAHRISATITKYPRTGPDTNRVFMLFHGIWDGPNRFDWLPGFLASYGQVLLVDSGANDRRTPADATRYLEENGLADREIYIMGVSKGSLVAVLTARLLIAAGRPPAGLEVASGPGSPAAVIWPRWYLRPLAHMLPAGPVTNRLWYLYWGRRRRMAEAASDPLGATHAAWCQARHVGAILTGARLLSRGIHLRDGELSVIRQRIVVEHLGDHMIRPSRSWWTQAMGTLTAHVMVPTPGHGDFTGARTHYEGTWRTMLGAEPT